MVTRTRLPQRSSLETTISLLTPAARAYFLGYASSTAPRLLTLLVTRLGKSRRRTKGYDGCDGDEQSFVQAALKIIRGGLECQRFATFCGLLVGGTTFLEIPLRRVFARFASSLSKEARKRLSIWLSTFISGWLSLKLLQSKDSEAFMNRVPPNTYSSIGVAIKSTKFAGRTMDLTIFAATRALDVIIGDIWARHKARRLKTNSWTRLERNISLLADPSIFASSCAVIMWAFIYADELLPRSYSNWIRRAAAVDGRLIVALRRCRRGEIIYGQDTGQAPLLQSMCADLDLPVSWGDPTISIPFPCALVHMGTSANCELHALRRFLKGSTMAFGMYAPLNLLLALRSPSATLAAKARTAAVSSARSSAFLGAFIAFFYYGICITRSRIGPLILGTSIRARQQIDSGICIATACALCGWSILLENGGRRKDIALFVAPRALATLLPRRYDLRVQWRETAVFAASVAVVFTCAKERPERVRGVLGRVLVKVLRE